MADKMFEILSLEERDGAFNRAYKRWEDDGRTESWEFDVLWKYIASETAKTQLESCQKAHDAIVREIFKEIEDNHSLRYPTIVPESGGELITICISVKDWRALKQK